MKEMKTWRRKQKPKLLKPNKHKNFLTNIMKKVGEYHGTYFHFLPNDVQKDMKCNLLRKKYII
jgi:hypothetical protein